MKVMWIGHGGLLFVSGKSKILIDPYLSNSLHAQNKLLKRKKGIKGRLFKIKPDVIILTSSHPDRTDFKTIKKFEKKRTSTYMPTILACESAFKIASEDWKLKRANNIMFEKGLEWTLGDMTITAVGARTDDRSAFGVIITDNDDGKKYYVASNTLYSEELISELPSDLYAAFIPISGTFGSMNIIDAARFSKKLNAQYTVPVQYGLFDKLKAEQFIVGGRVIPKIYKIIDFEDNTSENGLDFRYNEKLTSWKREKAKHESEIDDINTVTIDVPVPPVSLDVTRLD